MSFPIFFFHLPHLLHNLANSSPVIRVLRLTTNHLEALKDVDYVIDSASLHTEFVCARVQMYDAIFLLPIQKQEPFAQLSEGFFLPRVVTSKIITLFAQGPSVGVHITAGTPLIISELGFSLLPLAREHFHVKNRFGIVPGSLMRSEIGYILEGPV